MIVDLNGKQIESEAARLDPSDRGFTLGDGLFETIRVKSGKPKRLEAHLARLRAGAKVLAMTVPTTDKGIAKRVDSVVSANGLTDAAVRLTLSRGPGARGLLPPEADAPTLLITATPLPPPPEAARAIIAYSTRRNEQSPLAKIKSLSYLDNIIARQEAAGYGANEALLLNTQGRLAEATIANLFLLIDGLLVTPSVEEGALPGVVRAELIAKFRAEEGRLEVNDLGRGEEAFLTNALGVRPLIEVAGQPIGDGQPGLVTQMLAARL
ncbi:MAG: aminotransferase class IV [Rhodospirillaceae bacterium]|jgi:branched-chain amino acid aminotransferase|nr:aminotransferase class IV [Rhodospirillaceae bacterium]